MLPAFVRSLCRALCVCVKNFACERSAVVVVTLAIVVVVLLPQDTVSAEARLCVYDKSEASKEQPRSWVCWG